jgi:hypothetical protein
MQYRRFWRPLLVVNHSCRDNTSLRGVIPSHYATLPDKQQPELFNLLISYS